MKKSVLHGRVNIISFRRVSRPSVKTFVIASGISVHLRKQSVVIIPRVNVDKADTGHISNNDVTLRSLIH